MSVNSTAAPELTYPHGLLEGVSAVLVDGHHMDLCIDMARNAHTLGIPVIRDGGSYKEGIDTLLKYVDVAICSANFRLDNTDTLTELRTRGIPYGAISAGARPIQ